MAKRTKLSISFKMEVIKKFEENPAASKKALAEHFNVPESTLRGILKKRDAIEVAHRECGISSKKRSRIQGGKFEQFEKIFVFWLRELQASNIPVSNQLLKEKAAQLAKIYAIENFSASQGWIEKFKNRHGLTTHVLSGKCSSVNEETEEQWREYLSFLINGYNAKDIFNCDETGLLYKIMPDGISTLKREPSHGGKESKERLTALLCCNADGSEKMLPLVIGISNKLCCFKDVKKLPCEYTSNKTACMTSKIFLDFLNKFDEKMEKEKRKVLLFMDQCPAHLQDLPNFKNMKIVFFPANFPSKIQPLDLGVIRCVKVSYRKSLIRRLLAGLETKRATNEELKQITVLDAIHMLSSSWRSLSENCIKNCFKKAGFSFLENESDVPETEWEEQENDVNGEDWKAVFSEQVACTFNDFVNVDENLMTSQLHEIEDTATERNSEDKEDVEDAAKLPPTHTAAFEALETLRDYFQFYSGSSEETFFCLDELEETLLSHSKVLKQSSTLNYSERT